MFTLRKDGRYMGYWHDKQKKRHPIYDRDPERLFEKIRDKETPSRTTLTEVLDLWERQHRDEIKERTWANYRPHVEQIKDLYGDIPVEEITAFDVIQDLQAQKNSSLSFTVVNSRRCIWRMALDYAVGERLIPYNPALGVKNPKDLPKGTRSAPDDDVIDAILVDAHDMDFGFIPFFLLCTGLRRTEALHRPTKDVDLKNWEIRIPKAKTPDGVRTVPIIKPLREPLKEWMEAHPGEWLFPHHDYYAGRKNNAGFMTDSNWETAWKKYCTAHGWIDYKGNPTIGAHHLRHATATLLYESGVDVYTAQHILGHANVTTTLDIYTELRKQHARKNVGKFERSMAKIQTAANKKAEGK